MAFSKIKIDFRRFFLRDTLKNFSFRRAGYPTGPPGSLHAGSHLLEVSKNVASGVPALSARRMPPFESLQKVASGVPEELATRLPSGAAW